MQNNKVLKKLLAVATVAAMFSTFGVHAQTSGSSATSGTGQDATAQTGKTTREGTAGNTGSKGTEESKDSMQGATQGSSGQGTMGSSSESAANPAVSGTSAGSAGVGATTREGTVGNTGSQGMESREPSKADSASGQSGASGMSGQGASAGGAAGAGTAAGGATKGSLSKADEKILAAMAQANIAEIEAGKLAQSKSQNDQVKSFAQQMIDDHTKALNDVQAVAQQKGVTLPTEPDARHKAMATKLQAMSGEAFDKAYIANAGVADHKKVYSMLISDEKRAKDPDVKAAAAKMAPVVEQHLKSAKQLSTAKSGTTSGK